MKVYLDNNVVSAIGRNDTLEEAEAISALLRAFDEGKVELVTYGVYTEINQWLASIPTC